MICHVGDLKEHEPNTEHSRPCGLNKETSLTIFISVLMVVVIYNLALSAILDHFLFLLQVVCCVA